MNEKLKPCPFCGGECKIKAAEKEYIGFTIEKRRYRNCKH